MATLAAFLVTFIDDLDLDVDGSMDSETAEGWSGLVISMGLGLLTLCTWVCYNCES